MVRKYPEQGDIVTIEGVSHKLLVVSNQTFNDAGGIVVCPIVKNIEEGALHIPVDSARVKGTAVCEQLKCFQVKNRSFRVIDSISFFQVTDISDAIQGIFEFI